MTLQSALGPVQGQAYALLSGDATLSSLLGNGKVFDYVPSTTTFPYVCFVDFTEEPEDTMGDTGRKITATIDAFSQGEGYKQVQAIMDQVITLLNNDDITVIGWQVQSSIYTQGTLNREVDGLTRHASMTFEITVHI